MRNEDAGDRFLEYLQVIADEDAEGLKKAQKSYGNSWKSRGGVGAFMMLARKWDRLENRVKRGATAGIISIVERIRDAALAEGDTNTLLVQIAEMTEELTRELETETPPYDIFAHVFADQRSEGVIDDIRDLRRYLMLVEAELRARGFHATHRDNQ